MTPRAPSLSAEERRKALIEATAPLVLQRGPAVSTRDIARAAGVAEGTIFRVFDTKDELVLEAVRSIFNRTDHLEALAAIDPSLPLAQRLVAVMEIWQRTVRRMVEVFVVFRGNPDRQRFGDFRTLLDKTIAQRAESLIGGLLAPDESRLRRPIPEVVQLMGALAMMSVHPMSSAPPMTATDLVDLLLHGVALTDPDDRKTP